jgi:hypothetical protein
MPALNLLELADLASRAHSIDVFVPNRKSGDVAYIRKVDRVWL